MDKNEILASKPFSKLVKNRWLFSIIMTLVILTIYFGFILTIAFRKDLLASPISGELSIGIPIGLGIIFFSWILTGIYVWWANRYYDHYVKEIKDNYINQKNK